MSKEKQIEEMAKDLCDIECKGMKCNVCDYGCEYRMLAEALHNAGYRKQSEVITEFAEKLKKYYRHIDKTAGALIEYTIDQKVKEYLEGGADDA